MALQLPSPNFPATNVPLGETTSGPSVGIGSFRFKFVYGAVVCCVALAALAYYNVDFIQKHAPTLNAKLHGGEITDESDAAYRGLQMGDDIAALDADTTSKDWAGIRSEILSRQHYLTDLTEQNAKFQSRAALERSQNVGATDPCEQLALDEMIPAMNDYTTVENDIFSVIRRNPTPSDATGATLDSLSKQEDAARTRLRASVSDYQGRGCK